LYFSLSVYFWRHRHANDPAIRAAAYSGLAVSFSTVVFGLTIDVLVPVMVTALLALLSATFLAIIDSRKGELSSSAGR
ncbi:MAG TPA: polymerase, partial [Paraburkholderia sp.]|nr:polymerase [Paraburkholderia sp.]